MFYLHFYVTRMWSEKATFPRDVFKYEKVVGKVLSSIFCNGNAFAIANYQKLSVKTYPGISLYLDKFLTEESALPYAYLDVTRRISGSADSS